uniref:Nicotinamide N-methyltransferase-like n=2 Tax=Caenorhabditis tropicalis TaxID=1561998 RepID=A0A1I7URD1_9PELO
MNSSTLLPSPGPPGVLDDFQMSCRFSNLGNHSPESFDSVSCGACFYFIYMILDHYKASYITQLCEDNSGILVCPSTMDESQCHCQNRALVYNLPEFALNSDAIEDGTRVSLFALPVFAQLMLQTMRPSERETLLDIGAGPTVYSALCFRDVSKRVHLADYVERNLDVLRKWVRNEETIDWVPTIKMIKRTEGGPVPTEKVCEEVEEKARGLVKSGGIHFADVHQEVVVPELDGKQVDILVSIFTLESACRNYEEYCRCAQNMMRNLRSGGRFVLGSVLEDDEYNSGRQTIFHLLNLREQMILDALSACGLDVANAKKYVLDGEGVMFLMATKL